MATKPPPEPPARRVTDPPGVVRRITLDLSPRDAATLAAMETITGDTAATVLRNALRHFAATQARKGE